MYKVIHGKFGRYINSYVVFCSWTREPKTRTGSWKVSKVAGRRPFSTTPRSRDKPWHYHHCHHREPWRGRAWRASPRKTRAPTGVRRPGPRAFTAGETAKGRAQARVGSARVTSGRRRHRRRFASRPKVDRTNVFARPPTARPRHHDPKVILYARTKSRWTTRRIGVHVIVVIAVIRPECVSISVPVFALYTGIYQRIFSLGRLPHTTFNGVGHFTFRTVKTNKRHIF